MENIGFSVEAGDGGGYLGVEAGSPSDTDSTAGATGELTLPRYGSDDPERDATVELNADAPITRFTEE